MASLRTSLNQGQTNFEHTFAARVYFYDEIQAKGGGKFQKDVTLDEELYVTGDAFFAGNVTIEKNLIVKGFLDFENLLVRNRLDVGVGGTVFTADASTERVGIGTTVAVERFQVLSGDNSFVVTDDGIVGIGTTVPVDFTDDGSLKLDIDGSVSIAKDLLVKRSFDVGVGGTLFTADTRTDKVGIGTTAPLEKVQILSGNDSIVVTDQGVVGVGTTTPADFSNDGSIKLDVNGSVSIQKEIYDSRNLKGLSGNFLSKDENGITWVSFEPAFQEGIFLQDEGVYVPIPGQGGVVGAGQSFSIINFVQRNSLGLGTDTLVPTARDPQTVTGLATIFTNDLWGFNGSGDDAPIYRDTRVGIKQSNPQFDLDVNGTLNVDGATTLNDTLDVDLATTLNNTLDVDGATTLNNTLDVDGVSTFNDETDATSTTNASVQIDGGVGIVKKLFIGGDTKVESTTNATASSAVAALQVVGGAAIGKKLFVGNETKVESETDATASDATAALQVVGGAAIGKKLFVGEQTKLESNVDATASNASAALQVVGGAAIGKKLFVGEQTKLENTLELENAIIDINQQTGVDGKDYRLASVGTGVSWRPSGVETKKTIWVSKSGDDSNSGLLEGDAKATVGAAATVAQPGDTIKIRPGIYVENNPIGLQRDVSITGEDIRLVTIEPQNTDLDVFWVRRGCLIENLNFAGENVGVTHTGGAVAFPITGVTANSGYTVAGPADEGPTKRWRSPYVRNCTNFMTGSIGMRINGDDAIANFTGTVIPGADLKSMVCDSFTQYNEAGIGVSLTNNAYAQLVSIFTINNDIAIYADTGAQCDLTNSNSSFGNFGLVAVGLGATQFTGKVNAGVIPGDNSDVVVGKGVTDTDNNPRRPFDGQALYFKIDLSNYPDVPTAEQATGRITAPLQELSSIKVIGSPGGFSPISPPSVVIRDNDGTLIPKGPQGIIAEASATVDENGILTAIDVINSGRNYLPTQNIVVDVDGNTALATAVMEPIYFTISEATENMTGITTMTFNEFVPYELFEDDPFTLQRISRILTSSHSFEYVGSGTSINTSLPFQGALPIKENEVVVSKGAQIPFTSTDQKGNFDIGEGIQVDQTTSTVRGRDFSKAIQAEVTPLILALR